MRLVVERAKYTIATAFGPQYHPPSCLRISLGTGNSVHLFSKIWNRSLSAGCLINVFRSIAVVTPSLRLASVVNTFLQSNSLMSLTLATCLVSPLLEVEKLYAESKYHCEENYKPCIDTRHSAQKVVVES